MEDPDFFAALCAAAAPAPQLPACLEAAGRAGIALEPAQITALAARRAAALEAAGRVEFGPGVLPGLIERFGASPCFDPRRAEEILAALQELFYTLKTETQEILSDDELLDAMLALYNGRAQGSVAYLAGADRALLVALARGTPAPAPGQEDTDDDTDTPPFWGDRWEADEQ